MMVELSRAEVLSASRVLVFGGSACEPARRAHGHGISQCQELSTGAVAFCCNFRTPPEHGQLLADRNGYWGRFWVANIREAPQKRLAVSCRETH
jgi:hypothetical protein